ncbi:hypothetical protein GGF31_005939 [Allomyces arbusculus]|nr:hypothetical protein GGF31_005939 [Allomyces arbusculus]
MSAARSFLKTWYRHEVLPIVVVVGAAVSGATFYVARLARHQEVVWTRENPQPWNRIQSHQNTKFVNLNKALTEDFKREW